MKDKILTFIRNCFSNVDEQTISKSNADSASYGNNKVRLSMGKICWQPFGLIIRNDNNFIKLASVYSILLSIISIVMGFSYMCVYAADSRCSDSVITYFIYAFIKILILCSFISSWYKLSLSGKTVSFWKCFYQDKTLLKIIAFILLMFFFLLFPVLSTVILIVRVPNPNWQIEIIFFALVSLGYLVPFISFRFYSCLGLILKRQPLPSRQNIWHKTNGTLFNTSLSLFIIFFTTSLFSTYFYSNFRAYTGISGLYIDSVSEFIFNLIVLFGVTLFVNHCHVLAEQLYNDINIEDSQNEK